MSRGLCCNLVQIEVVYLFFHLLSRMTGSQAECFAPRRRFLQQAVSNHSCRVNTFRSILIAMRNTLCIYPSTHLPICLSICLFVYLSNTPRLTPPKPTVTPRICKHPSRSRQNIIPNEHQLPSSGSGFYRLDRASLRRKRTTTTTTAPPGTAIARRSFRYAALALPEEPLPSPSASLPSPALPPPPPPPLPVSSAPPPSFPPSPPPLSPSSPPSPPFFSPILLGPQNPLFPVLSRSRSLSLPFQPLNSPPVGLLPLPPAKNHNTLDTRSSSASRLPPPPPPPPPRSCNRGSGPASLPYPSTPEA